MLKNTESLYHNYKGFFSQLLLAVCNAKYEFIFIDVDNTEVRTIVLFWETQNFCKRLESY